MERRCPISAWRGFRGVEDLEQSQDVRGCCVTATELLVASVDQRAVVASRALPFAGEVTIDSARIVERERKAVVSMPTERRNRVLPTEVPNDLCFRLLIEPEREPRNLPGAPVRVVVLRQNARQNFPEVPLQGDCVQHAQVHQPRTGLGRPSGSSGSSRAARHARWSRCASSTIEARASLPALRRLGTSDTCRWR